MTTLRGRDGNRARLWLDRNRESGLSPDEEVPDRGHGLRLRSRRGRARRGRFWAPGRARRDKLLDTVKRAGRAFRQGQ
jgi:hypothetical protein